MVAAVAAEEPDTAVNIAQPNTLTCKNRPGMRPSQARPANISSPSRERSRISPIRMKSGRAAKGLRDIGSFDLHRCGFRQSCEFLQRGVVRTQAQARQCVNRGHLAIGVKPLRRPWHREQRHQIMDGAHFGDHRFLRRPKLGGLLIAGGKEGQAVDAVSQTSFDSDDRKNSPIGTWRERTASLISPPGKREPAECTGIVRAPSVAAAISSANWWILTVWKVLSP